MYHVGRMQNFCDWFASRNDMDVLGREKVFSALSGI